MKNGFLHNDYKLIFKLKKKYLEIILNYNIKIKK